MKFVGTAIDLSIFIPTYRLLSTSPGTSKEILAKKTFHFDSRVFGPQKIIKCLCHKFGIEKAEVLSGTAPRGREAYVE